ncbi:hypothetical protein [Thalassovita sp.]|uniref:hypothetical protein n=1 Tax=Thalassovita sp. TaxID=1979401 RepID=UPI002880CA4A|nr:hypothetical protein [Thalassovita sp.]MDF1801436.1 hypothetical protein [Thalassovita sp.]
MFTHKTIVAATALSLLPLGAYAGSLETTFGAFGTLVFDENLDKTDDLVELEVDTSYSFDSGAYIGAYGYWDSSASTDEFEFDLYLGYAGDISDKAGYDVFLTGYWFNDTGYSNYDVTVDLTYAFSDSIEATYELVWDPDAETTDNSIALEIGYQGWTITPLVGVDSADDVYTELSFLYGLDSGLSFEVLFEDSETSTPTISLIAGYEYTIPG